MDGKVSGIFTFCHSSKYKSYVTPSYLGPCTNLASNDLDEDSKPENASMSDERNCGGRRNGNERRNAEPRRKLEMERELFDAACGGSRDTSSNSELDSDKPSRPMLKIVKSETK